MRVVIDIGVQPRFGHMVHRIPLERSRISGLINIPGPLELSTT